MAQAGTDAGPGAGAAGQTQARPVGSVALLALGINGIVGVGIFFAPADVASLAPGRASILVFAATALVLMPVALVFASLGGRFEHDGGPVLFAREAFGRTLAYFVGWFAYVAALFSTSATVVGLTRSVMAPMGIESAIAERGVALGLVSVLALICASGISISAQVWTLLTALKLIPLILLAGASLLFAPVLTTAISALPAPPVAAPNWFRAALVATFAYQGFEIVPLISGQVRSPQKAVPRAVLGAVGLSAALYLLLQWACVRGVPNLAIASAPLAQAAGAFGGQALARLVGWGATLSALGIAFGMLAMTPRYLAALAEGEGLPLGLERTGNRGVPLRALFATWLIVAGLVMARSRAELFTLSGLAVVLQYIVTAAALFALAKKRGRGLTRAHVMLAACALAVGVSLLWGAEPREWLVAGAAGLLGALLRGLGRRSGRSQQASAL